MGGWGLGTSVTALLPRYPGDQESQKAAVAPHNKPHRYIGRPQEGGELCLVQQQQGPEQRAVASLWGSGELSRMDISKVRTGVISILDLTRAQRLVGFPTQGLLAFCALCARGWAWSPA